MPKENFPYEAIAVLGRVLEENSKKYEAGHWRRVKVTDHCNHAVEHLRLFDTYINGYGIDCGPEDLDNAFVRLAMAVAVRETINRKADIVNLNQIMEFDYSHTYTWHDDWF